MFSWRRRLVLIIVSGLRQGCWSSHRRSAFEKKHSRPAQGPQGGNVFLVYFSNARHICDGG